MNAELGASDPFFTRPILNSPYEAPRRHWELDERGQPTQKIIETRRGAKFISPIPRPKKTTKTATQETLVYDEGKGLSTKEQQYDPTPIINEVRGHVAMWRSLPNPTQWGVTPETARLLQHWRQHAFAGVRPFFCQVEAIETAVWLTEVAPNVRHGRAFLEHLASANRDANPELKRLALKLATGAGKTTVMAMIIAWQTVNAVRRPGSKQFTRGFLVCAPGLTIKERLRVLQPSDPDSYYADRELVPSDMLVRSGVQLSRAQAAVKESGMPFKTLDEHVETVSGHVSIGTMPLAKGLEFRAVVVMACDDEVVPLQERIEAVGDEADLEEVYDTERQLLYVACTRARDELLVTSVEPASEFLDDLGSHSIAIRGT